MIVARSAKGGSRETARPKKSASKEFTPTIGKELLIRDYQAALTIIDFCRKDKLSRSDEVNLNYWKACCFFRLGEYRKALEIFTELLQVQNDEIFRYNKAVCHFYLGSHKEALNMCTDIKECSDKNKLMLHLSNNNSDSAVWQSKMKETAEDQFCLASHFYIQGQYQDAIDIYKKVLANNRACIAANVYIAICYYKLDYYDVSQEVLAAYLTRNSDSTIAANLKACNIFKLYNGEVAEKELQTITSEHHSFGQDLMRHNAVVFRQGEGALKVWPELVDRLPEARLNLAAYRLKTHEPELAAELLTDDISHSGPNLHILRGIAAVEQYYKTNDENALTNARASFEALGTSVNDCDTVPGRQSMASALILAKRYSDALIYLNSIRSFFVDDDVFNYNYGQTKLALSSFKEAEECLLKVKSENITSSHTYVSSLCRCLIMNGKPESAWDLCLQNSGSADSVVVLQLIANDCYKMEHYLVSARAFHMLDRMDRSPETWEGLRGACSGAVQDAVVGLQLRGETSEKCSGVFREIAGMMRGSPHAGASSFLQLLLKCASSVSIVI